MSRVAQPNRAPAAATPHTGDEGLTPSARLSGQEIREPMFTPSSTDLLDMIRRAEAKFDADRKRMFEERFERNCAINARLKHERRQNNARRYINVGDTP